MNLTDNSSSSADNSDSVSTTNFYIHVTSTNDNPRDYSSFDMSLVSNYTNNQLIYYYIISAISAAEQAQFQQLMKQHKTFLEILE